MAPTGPSRNQPAVTEMATSPLSRLPRSPLRIRRAFSATTLLDALRELARNDSARDALMAELGPLLARRPRQRAAHSVETRTLAALVLGLGVLVLVTRSAHNHEASARVLALAATPPQPPALPPRPTSTKLELAVLGACGTVAGLGLARWRPARVLLRRFSAALVEAAMSNGAVHVHVPPQPLTSVLGHARRIAHALLPSSAVEWLLVALNVLLVSRLYLFTQSLEFVAVRAAHARSRTRAALAALTARRRAGACAGDRLDSHAAPTHGMAPAVQNFL